MSVKDFGDCKRCSPMQTPSVPYKKEHIHVWFWTVSTRYLTPCIRGVEWAEQQQSPTDNHCNYVFNSEENRLIAYKHAVCVHILQVEQCY